MKSKLVSVVQDRAEARPRQQGTVVYRLDRERQAAHEADREQDGCQLVVTPNSFRK